MKPAIKFCEDTIDDIDKTIAEIELAIKAENAPSFTPNTNLGEGNATIRNLQYRQQLLSLLKDAVYTPVVDMLNDPNQSPDQRITFIDKCIDDYISKGNIMVETTMNDSYSKGCDIAESKLKAAGVPIPKRVANPPRVQSIIRQQQMNIEDIGLSLRGRLRQLVNVQDVMGYYGK